VDYVQSGGELRRVDCCFLVAVASQMSNWQAANGTTGTSGMEWGLSFDMLETGKWVKGGGPVGTIDHKMTDAMSHSEESATSKG
jgi:hypothetical protein